MADTPCALCGEPILNEPHDPEDSLSDEHVPPKQFYPKSMRSELRASLWTVPTHRKCNASYKLDEEHFYHHFYALVGAQNEETGKMILDDLRRRMEKPQSRVIVGQMLKQCSKVSPGGILLPPGLIYFKYDPVRIQRVVIKIAQCLFYRDHRRHVPNENCRHIALYENPTDVPEMFAQLLLTERQAVSPEIFCYWRAEFEGFHYYAMIFWAAFMSGAVFEDPQCSSSDG